ncbi:MKK3, partial [Symbiodinium sp. KB8]
MRHQLLSEVKALFASNCSALVSFHGASYGEGQVNIVLEYMNLGGLDNIKKKVPVISERVLAAMTFQILWGLGYLKHEKRMHRDIKPQNILLNTKGEVKLTDFGLSKEMMTGILAKTFVGTFKYMSPERMKKDTYDYASDIWSVGIILIECATGKYPFASSDSVIDLVAQITN